jgi:hypothetical protein
MNDGYQHSCTLTPFDLRAFGTAHSDRIDAITSESRYCALLDAWPLIARPSSLRHGPNKYASMSVDDAQQVRIVRYLARKPRN